MIRLGLYVHVPFCQYKCDYCAFYSIPLKETTSSRLTPPLVQTYLQGMKDEITQRQKDAPQGVSSLFIGGGTPTVLTPTRLEYLLRILHEGFGMSDGMEKTVESNPGTLSSEKLAVLQRYGINRISLGAQSFSDAILARIGRIHRSAEIREAVSLIRASGCQNLNLDLMFGLPGQTLKVWQESVVEALSLSPEHISLYALSLEEGTPLARRYSGEWKSLGLPARGPDPEESTLEVLPDDDLQADMYEWAVERLKASGYTHYEVSNFALPGRECQHNLAIWRGREYVGLGPGAVSCINGTRWKNSENVLKYEKLLGNGEYPSAAEDTERLSSRQLMAERMVLGLRLQEGVNIIAFREDFGVDMRDIYPEVLERYLRQGILRIRNGYLCLDPRYIFIGNAILRDFV
ncbi:MAG: radical SAM family heme chaperone HemW [Desulfitobacteriaceae bacterium]